VLKKYYVLAKPGIIYGNLITAVAGYLFASDFRVNIRSFIGLIVGLSMVIGSACVINNIIDRDIDIKMERTKNRPSVKGDISLKQSLIYSLCLLLFGVISLIFTTNLMTLLIVGVGYVIYVSAYTLLKPRTHLATLIGSIAGATPIVTGYLAYSDHISGAVVIIGLMMLLWQMPHFYSIALYRESDYRKAGIPILPIVTSHKITGFFMVLYSLVFLIICLSLYWYAPVGLVYLTIMGVVGTSWLIFNIIGYIKKNNVTWARHNFIFSLLIIIVMSLTLSLR